MSDRARRVLLPGLVVFLVTFFSFVVHLLVLGTSAFPSGHIVDGKYLVEEHAKVIELTATQYWFSYIHGVVLVVVGAVLAILAVVYYYRGDLRDEYQDA